MASLLECTLRDGGYAFDFQWTKQDVVQIVGGLAALGFDYIETGFGLGIGAARHSKKSPLLTDIECTEISLANKGLSKIGCFFIPYFGTESDIEAFAEQGLEMGCVDEAE